MKNHQLKIWNWTCSSLLALLLLTATGCRKDLCYNHEEHSYTVKTLVRAMWEQEWERSYSVNWQEVWREEWSRGYEEFIPEKGEGIRSLVYDENGVAEGNLDSDGGRLYMSEGLHTLLFYNNDTEYIVFDDIASLPTASATTRTRTRGSFVALHQGERTITPPDMLYGAFVLEYTADENTHTYTLSLELQLKNGKTLTYTFDVSPMMRAQPRGGVILVDGIEVSDEDGAGGSGVGFEVGVDGWGDYIDIPLPLG